MSIEKLYRIDGSGIDNKLDTSEYKVISETPKGYWIYKWSHRITWWDEAVIKVGYKENQRWVAKDGKKRFAYPTREEALNGFIARKRRQIKILSNQLNCAKDQLFFAERELKIKIII